MVPSIQRINRINTFVNVKHKMDIKFCHFAVLLLFRNYIFAFRSSFYTYRNSLVWRTPWYPSVCVFSSLLLSLRLEENNKIVFFFRKIEVTLTSNSHSVYVLSIHAETYLYIRLSWNMKHTLFRHVLKCCFEMEDQSSRNGAIRPPPPNRHPNNPDVTLTRQKHEPVNNQRHRTKGWVEAHERHET